MSSSLPLGALVDPGPARRPERVNLHGSRVLVTPLHPESHGDDLYEATCRRPETDGLWTYLFEGPYRDRASFDRALQQMASSEDPFFFAIVDKGTPRVVGRAAYMRIEPAHRVIEVGNILYSPELQRTAGATEAMYLMARYVFEELGYRRYEWKCNALNAPSRRAALRLGFRFEGIFRQHMIIKGHSRDTAWYSMLDREWPDRKTAFERWLDPSNFETDGRQKRPLSNLRLPSS